MTSASDENKLPIEKLSIKLASPILAGSINLQYKSNQTESGKPSYLLEFLLDNHAEEMKKCCFIDLTIYECGKEDHPFFHAIEPERNKAETGYKSYTDLIQEFLEPKHSAKASLPVSNSIALQKDFRDHDSIWVVNLPDYNKEHDSDSEQELEFTEARYQLKNINTEYGLADIKDALEAYRNFLKENQKRWKDSEGKLLTSVVCVNFQLSGRSGKKYCLAQMFFGTSSCVKKVDQDQESFTDSFRKLINDLGLAIYRDSSYMWIEKQGRETGLKTAIDTFAHQIRGVAVALSDRWSVSFPEWECLRSDLEKNVLDDKLHFHVDKARVIPAPQLYEALRKTLIIWAQTRHITDMYPEWPCDLKTIIKTAWGYSTSARLCTGHINRFASKMSSSDLIMLWTDEYFQMLSLSDIPDLPLNLSEEVTEVEKKVAEEWLCNLTRITSAVFDNYWTHANLDRPIKIFSNVNYSEKKLVIKSSNIARGATSDDSRLRPAMRGEDVLISLAKQIKGSVDYPGHKPRKGEAYNLTITTSIPEVFFHH